MKSYYVLRQIGKNGESLDSWVSHKIRGLTGKTRDIHWFAVRPDVTPEKVAQIQSEIYGVKLVAELI